MRRLAYEFQQSLCHLQMSARIGMGIFGPEIKRGGVQGRFERRSHVGKRDAQLLRHLRKNSIDVLSLMLVELCNIRNEHDDERGPFFGGRAFELPKVIAEISLEFAVTLVIGLYHEIIDPFGPFLSSLIKVVQVGSPCTSILFSNPIPNRFHEVK